MRTMVLDAPGVPLRPVERPEPRAGPGQLLLHVRACGVCRTDLHLRDLWRERTLRSVANLTRDDARELLALAPTVPIRTHVTTYPLERAEQALDDLRAGHVAGSAVVVP